MTAEIPTFSKFLLPTLRAIQALGGSASIPEIESAVISAVGFSEEQQAVLHNTGPQTKIGYRIAWARTYLKWFDFLTNSERGVWSLTEPGDQFLRDEERSELEREHELNRLKAERIKMAAEARTARRAEGPASETVAEGDEGEDLDVGGLDASWKERIIQTLTSTEFSPAQFERLAMRLLREADFETVTVTGRSGDQGIDGVGVYRLGLLTFPVFFQCKRYVGSVGPGEVRDFRGAMQGRGDKGLLITTGTFTTGARAEAVRAGATPIDLIDGERLCDLLKNYRLGVSVATRTVEEVEALPNFFAEI